MNTPRINIDLAKFRKPLEFLYPLTKEKEKENLKVVPGSIVTQQTDLMRGHGTYLDEANDEKVLRSSVIGTVSCVNKLITVAPRKSRYNGEVGDVVVGQVLEVTKKRWRVDVHANQDAVLLLSFVDLPSGEIRRQNDEDELWMKDYLTDGDFLCAQVYNRYTDGSLSLSVRGEKFGKLGQGILVKVPPSLVKQNKLHFHSMTFGIFVITGSNGYIWISPSHEYIADNDIHHLERQYTEEEHTKVSRMRACIIALSETNTPIYDMTMLYAYEASLNHEVSDLQKPEVMHEVVNLTREMFDENSAK